LATEKGVVIRVSPTTAWVKTMRTSACETCEAKGTCHTLGGGKEMEVEAINTPKAQVGDKVIIGFETASLIKISFLVYVFPILGLIAGAAIGQELAPAWNLSAPAFSVILGFVFFSIAFLCIRQVGKKLAQKDTYQARIVRIRQHAPADEACYVRQA